MYLAVFGNLGCLPTSIVCLCNLCGVCDAKFPHEGKLMSLEKNLFDYRNSHPLVQITLIVSHFSIRRDTGGRVNSMVG